MFPFRLRFWPDHHSLGERQSSGGTARRRSITMTAKVKNPKLPKIVILIGDPVQGGSVREAYLLARGLRQSHGICAEVWALWEGEFPACFEGMGIPVNTLDFVRPRCPIRVVRTSHWAIRLTRIALELRRAGIDVLVTFGSWPNVIGALTHKFANIGLCVWGQRKPEVVPWARIAARNCRRFAANSTAGFDFLSGELRVSKERISYIPGAVDDGEHSAEPRWRLRIGVKPAQRLVAKVSQISNARDHATLLGAWKIVEERWHDGPAPVLALAGAFGDAYPACQEIILKNGMDSTVRFLGEISDVPGLLRASDLVLFSSINEGMPTAILEGMVAGKAIIATNLPGMRDALGPNANDMLVPPRSPEALAERILEILENNTKRETAGAANRRRARSEFTAERMVERYLNLIGECFPTVGLVGAEWSPNDGYAV